LTNTPLTVGVPDWEWESLEMWGEDRKVTGHRIGIGSLVELQLLLEPRHVLKYWIRKPDSQREWAVDPEHDLMQSLALGAGSEPVRRLLQPLRPGTNLAYFEGRVEQIASEDSKANPSLKMVQALLDFGYPVVLEAEVGRNSPPPIVSSETEEIIGICRLFATITVSNSMYRAPLKARVLAVNILKTIPRDVYVTLEPTSNDIPAEHVLEYSRFDKKR